MSSQGTSTPDSVTTEPSPVLESVSLKVQDALGERSSSDLKSSLGALYSENAVAKILRTAAEDLLNNNPPAWYPELVPQSGPKQGRYAPREIDFWTAGFFPGCIYALLERAVRYPHSLGVDNSKVSLSALRQKLRDLGHVWSEPLAPQALRTDTHDLGFVIMPHMRPRWELYGDDSALKSIITAAESLASRYDSSVQAIRSWDTFDWHAGVAITSMVDNFLVIIDSMCNMDLLFYAAAQSQNQVLHDIAVTHARTLLKSHLRVEPMSRKGYDGRLYSTIHLINFSPTDGAAKEVRTAQGYSADSTWSRGQAWGILGYAQTYQWSGHAEFLDAACGLAEYFLLRLENAPDCVEVSVPGRRETVGRYVPLWDFDAPIENPESPLRDTSAGVAAANGMLIISQALAGQGEHTLSARYLDAAIKIVQDTLDLTLAQEQAQLVVQKDGELGFKDTTDGERFDSILKHSTVCYNALSFRKNSAHDHGLVYADYYLLEFGTNLLRMGLV